MLMANELNRKPPYITPTCYCPSCEMFVKVNPKGECDNCWKPICFLQDEANNFEFYKGEIKH